MWPGANAESAAGSSHPSLVLEAAQASDKGVKGVLLLCSLSAVTPDMVKQASLSLQMGGLGSTSAVAISTKRPCASFGEAARTVSSRCNAESLACLQRYLCTRTRSLPSILLRLNHACYC